MDKIHLDCDRIFEIDGVLGEIVTLFPNLETASCVFMYEQGWGAVHTFDQIKFE